MIKSFYKKSLKMLTCILIYVTVLQIAPMPYATAKNISKNNEIEVSINNGTFTKDNLILQSYSKKSIEHLGKKLFQIKKWETELKSIILPVQADADEDTMSTVQARIDAAADGGTVIINNSFSITGSTPLLISKNITLATAGDEQITIGLAEDYTGRHIRVSGIDVTLTLAGVELAGNNPAVGGGIQSAATKFTLNDAVIKNCSVSSLGGGGIYSSAGAVTINRAIISGNSSTLLGGGIYSVGALTINASSISDNHALTYGGGVYVQSVATTINDSVITGNTAASTYGGGVYSAGPVTVTGGTISYNKSLSYGGGIYTGTGTGTVTLNGGTISGNNLTGTSTTYGGGICTSNASITVTDGIVSGNTDATYGGGIYTNTGSINISGEDTKINNNIAKTNGGGIYTASGAVMMAGGVINGNTATGGSGGGICVSSNIATLTLTDVMISNNFASNYGGGISFSGNIVISGTTVSNNHTTTSNTSYGGGGIYSGGTSMVLGANTKIIDNTSAGYGGGIRAAGAVTATDVTINGNSASYGGGIYTTGTAGIVTLTGATINENTASNYGGGIYAGSLIINERTVIQANKTTGYNSAFFYGGGGIYSAGNLEINGGTITGNTSAGYGGGIYAGYTSESKITIDNAIINGNTAVNQGGGGLYVYNSTCITKITNTAIKGNTLGAVNVSNAYGGGIFAYGILEIYDSEISGNIASAYGGGIYTHGSAVTIENSKISGNTALNPDRGYGGGFYCNSAGAVIKITGGSISDNQAYGNGGGISTKSAITAMDMTISGNTVTNGSGGGMYAEGAIDVSGDAKIIENNALLGGGLYSKNNITVNGGKISGNRAATSGGGIYADTGNVTIMGAGIEISGNTAAAGVGGGIYVPSYNKLLKADGVAFANNISTKPLRWDLDAVPAVKDHYTANIHPIGLSSADGRIFPNLYNNYDVNYTLPNLTIYTITFNANGATSGTPEIASKSGYYGEIIYLSGRGTLENTGHNFLGWSTNKDAGQAQYGGNAGYTVTGNVILYAVWGDYDQYLVTYDGNGADSGSLPEDIMAYYPGDTVTLAGNTGNLAKTNHIFFGWSINPDAVGPDSSFTMGENGLTVYAVWQEKAKYTVEYDPNKGSGTAHLAETYYEGTTVTVLDQGEVKREGYTFLGWNTNQSAIIAEYKQGDTFEITGDIKFYAIWEKESNVAPAPVNPETADNSSSSYAIMIFSTLMVLLITLLINKQKNVR